MNVTLVCERFDRRGGGLEQWVVQLAERLQRRGHQTRVMAFRANTSPTSGITLHLLPWSPSRIERARIAEAALNDVAVDLIHDVGVGCRCHILHPQGGSRLANEERDTASQSWRERCGRWLRPAFWRWRAEWRKLEYRQYSRHTGLVIAPAEKVIRDLETRHVFPRERARLVPNGVDIDRFSPEVCAGHRMAMRHDLGLRDETGFLFVAHNLRLKGIRPLLRAISVIRKLRRQVKLLVIGHAPDRHTRNLVDRLGIAPVVLFRGFVPDSVPYYAAADAFVLPTYHDACSLSVLEAAACGLPAITTSDNGVAELITHGHDGFVLQSPDDIDGLASLMIELLDPAARARVGGPARALAVRHNLEASIGMIENVYNEVLRLAPDSRTSW